MMHENPPGATKRTHSHTTHTEGDEAEMNGEQVQNLVTMVARRETDTRTSTESREAKAVGGEADNKILDKKRESEVAL
jgi:hypothetical protein